MKSNREKIIDVFHKVKALGFVKSKRRHDTGIGKTFEDYAGVKENNLAQDDLYGYEIKSHREDASCYITLFTKAPSFPKGANAYLNSNYGTPYEDNPALHRIHTSMFATAKNTYHGRLSFQMVNDRQNRVLKIAIYNLTTDRKLDDRVGYTYEALEKILNKKLHNLFYVSAIRRKDQNGESFHFNNAEIYTSPSLDRFLDLLDNGKIMYDIRIGSYRSGRNIGKTHDHGSGFRILEKNLPLLYDSKECIE